MQSAMNRLSGFVRSRRKLVFGIWIALIVVSIPFASQQTKHLSGGGFEVPGAGSDNVDKEIARFKGQSTEPLGVVLLMKGGDRPPPSTAWARPRPASITSSSPRRPLRPPSRPSPRTA